MHKLYKLMHGTDKTDLKVEFGFHLPNEEVQAWDIWNLFKLVWEKYLMVGRACSIEAGNMQTRPITTESHEYTLPYVWTENSNKIYSIDEALYIL